MKYLHLHNILHRDLKPANILIGDNNQLKISDFGTCKEFVKSTVEMTFAGKSPRYSQRYIEHS